MDGKNPFRSYLQSMPNQVVSYSRFTDLDLYLFREGKHLSLFDKFGSHPAKIEGRQGYYFAVFAPAAREVRVVGDFNFWNGEEHILQVRWDGSGIWEGFIPGVKPGTLYKYQILSHHDHVVREKADPYAKCTELPPATASITWELEFDWKDSKWMERRPNLQRPGDPKSIYEVHMGSWKKNVEGFSLSYRELAQDLVDYVKELGFTHVELMPIQEHPYYPSWGYQSTSYFAPTRRYGDPEDLMYFIDTCHKEGIGVILDWVPSHFPADEHGLAFFDGSCVYEHPDPRKGYHPDWKSSIFNYERPEVRSFLLSSAHFWLEHYHVDALRVDAVASMIYLDYSREEGQWEPNMFGGNEYLAAIDFLKDLNASAYHNHPGIMMIAEESTAFPGVTKPVHQGGLGFGYKWMMGWMNDTLRYFERDPVHRSYHHNEISFSMAYAYSENYVMPLSHDEVVYGKKALLDKMPGDEWQRFAHLRLLYTYMFTHPGGKLVFMGGEIGQVAEWNINEQLEWFVLDYPLHAGIKTLIQDLNSLYRSESALHEKDHDPEGFTWIDHSDHQNCVLAYSRQCGESQVVVVLNFTPQTLRAYRLGVDKSGKYIEVLNSDEGRYQGSGQVNKPIFSEEIGSHGRLHSLNLTLPPLGGIVLKNK